MKTFMKGAALAALATVVMASSASAAQFIATYTVSAYSGNNGLEIETQDNSNNINFFLTNVGDFSNEALFKIWTDEDSLHNSDMSPKAITVHFNFTSPVSFGGDVTGSTFGEVDGKYENGHVTWNDPVILSFTGGKLKVTMNDADFNGGNDHDLDDGSRHGADISARFELMSGAVPEPATWAMMITGFGMAGVALRRRRYASIAA
jgi:opacity protein-like surface antigen